jgi:DNA repair protein RecN (Recombination protein N)
MLTTLRIRNLALVAELTLDLAPGLNVLTGETGAGKSVILGALGLVLGQRADRTLIRSGADACTVEAVFEVEHRGRTLPDPDLLARHGIEPCEGGQLILKRTFTAAGANRQFVNGSPTSLATLAEIAGDLVDLHGPHDHQSLLKPSRQLAVLDAFGGLGSVRSVFEKAFRAREEILAARKALVVDEQAYARQLDLLRFQVREIEAARLTDDDEALEAEHHRAANSARLIDLSRGALELLSEQDDAVLTRFGSLGRVLQDLQRLDPGVESLVALHGQTLALLQELQLGLSRYGDSVDIDAERLAFLEERLNLLQSLKRKYGQTLADVGSFGVEARRRLEQLEGRDAELVRLDAALQRSDEDLRRAGDELTAARRKLVAKLSKAAGKELAALGFRQSQLEVGLSRLETPSPSGFDACEFQFAPNPGEPARPLRAIASSGELARVMLALKTVLAREDEVPVLVFDEVDANVGGETASAVGVKLRQIAEQHQVLCITHLAPVAAAGHVHYRVTKEVQDGRTESSVTRLDRSERIEEVARMLGGATAAARRHAEELLGKGV